jgi:membrane fusion protein (multidrug efflux system)
MKLNEIKNTITAPSEAIIAEMGRTLAYVYRGGKAELVELTKGLRTESKVQVIKGLTVGDTLITSGTMQLREGMPVNVQIKN